MWNYIKFVMVEEQRNWNEQMVEQLKIYISRTYIQPRGFLAGVQSRDAWVLLLAITGLAMPSLSIWKSVTLDGSFGTTSACGKLVVSLK